jgi:hypothetical protein
MSGGRAERWVIGDVRRLLNRAEASSGTVTSTSELLYMRGQCQVLLAELLPLADYHRARLLALHHELERTLGERAVAPNGRETGQEGARTK